MEMWKENKNRIVSSFFYLGLILELLIVLVDKSALQNPLEGQWFRLTFLLFFFKVLGTKYTGKEWIWLIGFGILGGIVYVSTGENVILRVVVFVAAMKGIALRQVMKYTFWITLVGCLGITVLSFAGMMGEMGSLQEYRKDVFEMRYFFGMGHPNAFHCMFLMVLLSGMYLYQKKLSVISLLLLFAVNGVLFYFTGSKTGFGVAAASIVMVGIVNRVPEKRESVWIYLLGGMVFAGCIGISVWAAGNSMNTWDDPTLGKIDRLLSGRMSNLYRDTTAHSGALETWTLFAAPSHSQVYFDMGWVRMFYWFGILPGIVFTLLHLLLAAECYRKRDRMGLVMIVVLSVYTIVEAHIISVYLARNYLLFLFGAYGSHMLGAGDGREAYGWKIQEIFPKKGEKV